MPCPLIFSLWAQERSRGWLSRALDPRGHCHAGVGQHGCVPKWGREGVAAGRGKGEGKDTATPARGSPWAALQRGSQLPTPSTLSHGRTGLTFVTEPSSPASFALAVEVAHEVLADLGPLLIAGVWRALVRQV